MFQTGGRKVLGGGFAVILLGLSGCSSGRASTKVDESWMARVPSDQMEDVRQAQLVQSRADEEDTRAKVSLEDGKRELKVAETREKAAASHKKAAEGALEAAQALGQVDDINRTQNQVELVDSELAAARAETAWRKKTVATRESIKKMREQEREIANTELELTRFLTLQRSGDVRADKVDGDKLAKQLEKERGKAQDTQKEVDTRLQQQQQAEAQWKKAEAQVQAYGGSGK